MAMLTCWHCAQEQLAVHILLPSVSQLCLRPLDAHGTRYIPMLWQSRVLQAGGATQFSLPNNEHPFTYSQIVPVVLTIQIPPRHCSCDYTSQ